MNEEDLYSLMLKMETYKYITSDENEFSKTYNFTIQICNEDLERDIGSMQIMLFRNDVADFWDILDEESSTAKYVEIFNKDGSLKKSSILNKSDLVDIQMLSRVLFINSIALEEKYRGNKIFPSILKQAFSLLNIDFLETPIFLTAFPVQHEGKGDALKNKQFKIDESSLISYYESIGFVRAFKKKSYMYTNSLWDMWDIKK
ncbi:MAG: hypothetical protein WC656_01275 [Sulfurimonas sp.]|jgi:hypothetical protein